MKRLHLLFACALFTTFPAAAHADLSVKLSNEALADSSELIVIGRATSLASRWIDRTLVTAVTIQVAETIKGVAPGSVEVLLPGGIDLARPVPVSMTYAGAPAMRQGEDVFLFLVYADDVNGYVVNGFAQGKFSIMTDAGGVRRVNRDLRGSQLVEGAGISRGTVTMVSLAEFRVEIIGYVR